MTASRKLRLILPVFVGMLFCIPFFARGLEKDPRFLLTPGTGEFPIDSVFDVNIAIDTQGRDINAFKVSLNFPPEKLQVVSSNTGKSITGFWIRRPTYSNSAGTIDLEGAIPTPGINTSMGIIATITFRVKTLGSAAIRFDSDSVMYLNDGNGTQVNTTFQNGLYSLVLPPPLGPIVVSPTHPDQTKWYPVNDVVLRWDNQYPVEGYSYVLNKTPTDIPDNISEGLTKDMLYKEVEDGIHYFHIKALRGGVWGGVTHYGIKVQSGSPAGFQLDVQPGTRTSSKTVVVSFDTTDRLSGIDYYSAKIIRRDSPDADKKDEPFFFEVESPYVFKTDDYGSYDIIVRAHNHAGNFTEASEKISIVRPIFQVIAGEGLKFGEFFVIPWLIFWILVLIVLIILGYLTLHMYRWHLTIEESHFGRIGQNNLNTEKLNEMRQRFTKVSAVILVIGALVSLFGASYASAQSVLSPPVVNLVSKQITNSEIFYIGGRAAAGTGSNVIVYLESLTTGQTYSFSTEVSDTGEWLYTHPAFLQSDNYLLWTQLKVGEQTSPPSGQIQMTVSLEALQLGASRISYETLYLLLFSIFLAASIILAVGAIYFWRKGLRRREILVREVREAEDAVIRGFALLRKDIEAELQIIKRAKSSAVISEDEARQEQRLLKDLEEINQHIEKEMWDVEKALGVR